LARRGLKFFFNRQAVGYHYAVRSFSSWLSIPYAYGRNNVIFSRQLGQTWLITNVFEEFQSRHPFIRAVTWLCLDRPRVTAMVTALLAQVIQAGQQLKLSILPEMACSVLFNLRFYQGTSDELVGRQVFFRQVEAFKPSP
jgi:hypothetical protein